MPLNPERPTLRDWLLTLAYLAPAIAWAVVIYAFSAQSNPSVGAVGTAEGQWSPPSGLFHFGEFAVLAGLLLIGLWLLARRRLNSSITVTRESAILLLVAVLSIAYAASDELHQSSVEGREASFTDFLVDALGVMTALTIGRFVLRLLRNRGVA